MQNKQYGSMQSVHLIKKIQYIRFSKAVTLNSRNIFLKIVTTMCASDKSKMKCCWVLKTTTKCNLKGNQKH